MESRGGHAFLVPIVVGVLLIAGCGGKSAGSSSSTSTSTASTSTADWANSLCSALTTWSSSVTSAATSLKGNATKSSLQSTATDVTNATNKLVDDLKGLGKPNTQAGQQAKQAADKLSQQLKTDADSIKKAAEGASGAAGVLTAVSTVSATLVTVGDQLSAAFASLQKADAKGELEQALKQSSSCKSLVKTRS